MPYTWIDAVKDFLGALGSILVAFPWIFDFFLRKRRAQAEGLKTAGALSKLKSEIEASLKSKIDAPKAWDFVFTMSGLFCICASFLIAFIHGTFAG
jgi:hypothetical protein